MPSQVSNAESDEVPIEDRADLDAATREEIAAIVSRHRTLDDVVRWGLAHRVPRVVEEVVVQDEFAHDVVVPHREGLYLVYDTT